MRFIQIFTCLLATLCLSTASLADNHEGETPDYTIISIKDNLSMLQGGGGNIAVLTGDDGLLIIDDDVKAMSKKLEKSLKQFGGVKKINFLINTHWHGDHAEGNLVLGEHATIVAHENVRKRLMARQEVPLFDMVSEPYPEEALPSVTYSNTMHLHANGEDIEIMYFPNGHTDSDSVIFLKKLNVVHMGDHFFNGFFPFVDVDNGGDVLGMAKNVSAVLKMIDDNTVIIPGHGPLGKKAELEAFRLMLMGTSTEVKNMKRKGYSLERAKKEGLTEKWDDWTDGFLTTQQWIEIVWNSKLKKR